MHRKDGPKPKWRCPVEDPPEENRVVEVIGARGTVLPALYDGGSFFLCEHTKKTHRLPRVMGWRPSQDDRIP